ncbi:hypothetical protein [Rhizobium sp. NZLR10]|uniref:hypothetical protein n=1 Tax=Rhizobium sp. NZLR10 TaxID=2731097 RepID=UPI002180CDAE|nr:hypothetical protein [Rhizobium sp. NZLR10]
MEGSSLGRLTTGERFETERDIENRLLDVMKTTSGLVLVACSAQNIDRVVPSIGRRNGQAAKCWWMPMQPRS